MNKLIVIILLLLSIQGFSQLKMGLNIKPEISFANSNTYWFTCSYGVVTSVGIYKWLSINAGIGYQSKEYDFTKMPYTTDNHPVTNYLLHTVPIYIMPKLNIFKLGKDFQMYGIAGATMNTCIYEKIAFADESSLPEISSQICFYNLLISIGMGLEYSISKFSIFIEPAFNSVVVRNLNYYHPYNNTISMNIGCLYNFKKSE
jgi:hypothetical protein